ncbi:MAG: SMC-Scp complex subunit ScpB [Planctomycetota bacterium]|nr:SMC-Scp complex subunit ScpB [Planctomycetota bacterium]
MTEPEKISGDNDREAAPAEASTAPDDMDTVKRILEAILFASSEPVPLRKMRSAIGKPASERVKDALAVLTEDYQKGSRGMEIEEVAGGFRMVTNPDYSAWVLKVRAPKRDDRVSPAALETLSIVAYKQPIPRAEVDAIRGVNSGELLRRLLERGLVKIVGKAETLGRPLLYGTTKRFLEVFGLKRLEDLPKGEWEREGAKPGPLPQASKE